MTFSSLSPRWRKAVWVSIFLIVFYTLFGFLALPPIAKKLLVNNLTKELDRACSIEQVKVNPLTLSATVRGLSVQDPDNETLVSWDELYVNFQLSSFFGSSWNFKAFRLHKPHVRAELRPDGSWNFTDLLTRTNTTPKKPKTGKPVSVQVGTILLDEGTVQFADLNRTQPFRTVAGPFKLELQNLNTAPGITNTYAFTGTTSAKEQFSAHGNLALEPLESAGIVSLTGIALDRYSPYYRDRVRCDVNGVVSVKAGYEISLTDSNQMVRVKDGELGLQSLSVQEPGGTNSPTIELAEFNLSNASLDLATQTVRLGRIQTDGGKLDLIRSSEGLINLATLFSPPTNAAAPPLNTPPQPLPEGKSRPWKIALGLLELANYSVRFQDRSTARPVELNLDEISLQIQELTTEPNTRSHVTLSMQWNTNGLLRGEGQLGLFPPAGELALKLDAIGLQPLDRYLDQFVQAQVANGRLGLDGKATFAMPANGTMTAGFQGGIQLRNLAIMETPSDELLVAWRELDLRNVNVNLQQATINEIALDGFRFRFDRDQTNNNLALVLKSQPTTTDPAPPPSTAPNPNSDPYPVRIAHIAVTDSKLQLQDRSNPRPVRLAIDDLALHMTNVSNLPGTNMGLGLSLTLNTNGSVKGAGTIALFPPEADLQLELKGIALKDFDPYLEPTLDLMITGGGLDIGGRARVAMPTNGPLAASFLGNVTVRGFGTTGGRERAELVGWKNLSLTGFDLQLDPLTVAIDSVGLDEFSLKFVVSSNANSFSSLVQQPVAAQPTPPAPSKPPPPAGPEPRINIKEINLKTAHIEVTDRSLEPAVHLAVNDLTGKVSGISSEKVGSGTIALSGKIGKEAPFDISGRLDLLTATKDSDLKIQLKDVELVPFSPYAGRYLGHKLDQGRINIDIRTVIKGRDLASENVVIIDRFTLGDSVPSPDAVNAPIKLGIALLKDPSGQIELDVPVAGNLDDPEFRYGKVVWRAVLNLLLKAATSPFALLGKIAGGGDDADLSFLEFEPGTIEPIKLSKLDSLARALQRRPALNLEMIGRFNSTDDTVALQRRKLMEKLQADSAPEPTGTNAPVQAKFRMADYTNAVRNAFAKLTSTDLTETSTSRSDVTTPGPRPASGPPIRVNRGTLKGAELLIQRRPKPKVTPAEQPEPKTVPETPAGSPEPTATAPAAASFEEMESQFLKTITIAESELKDLATARAQRVKEQLMTSGMIPEQRLSVVADPTPDASNTESRVHFKLR